MKSDMQNKGNHILSFSAWRGAIFFYLLLGTVTATNSFGQANLLLNPSFEIGNPATGWASISNWFSSQSGDLVAAGDAHQGTNVMRMLAYGSGSKLLNQTFPVTAGRVYSADGWLKTVAGAQSFSPANGYCTVLFRFFDSTGARVGANCDTIHFVRNGPTNWTQYSTGPCYAQAGAVTGEVSCYYYAGADNTSTGWVYYDDMHAVTTTPSQAGTILNPDFEVQGSTTLADIPYWTAFGNAGIVSTNYSRSGRFSLNLYFPETLLGETWTATPGTKYVTSGYIFSPGGFASTTNAHGEILLQFLDSTGTNVLQTYESPYFTPASASNQWIYVEASGIAPAGTVSGRTMCALLGQTNGYNGSLYFDDVNQGVIATTDTVAGILHNPGFDDGGPGNAYDLSVSTNLPHWTWLGGTNGGFITQSYERDGVQSLAITYPSNLIGQSMGVVTGSTYVLDGYMSSPVGQAISNSAYGALILEFYIGTNLASSVSSAPFTSNSTAGTWYHFAVTNRAPWSGSVSSRVLCAVFGPTTNFGGAVYFDSLSLTGTAIAVTNQQAGALWNPGFEYTAVGTVLAEIDNWTALGNAGTVLDSYHRSGNNALQIYFPGTLISQTWPASQSNRYETSAYAFSPSANRFTSTTNAQGVVVLQFLDATGTNILTSYTSAAFTPANPADTWTNLLANGVAPAGTVYGRTLIGMVGATNGFSGSIWFDDATQRLVQAGSSVSGLLHNPGFEDGPPGNAYNLMQTGDLPSWIWLGGTNGGFIAQGYAYEGVQALSITYPNNLIGQMVPVTTGKVYVADGWISSPVGQGLTNGAYGSLLLEFFNGAYLAGTSPVSVLESAHFTATNYTPGTWYHFGVTNRSPWSGTATAEVLCTVSGATTNFGGAVYFDGLSFTDRTVVITNQQAGALWNPGFEYTAAGTVLGQIDNWTALGNAGQVLNTYSHSGNNAVEIYFPGTLLAQTWSATKGWKYESSAWAFTPSALRFTSTSNAYGVVLLQFLDATATNVLATYQSPEFTTANPPDVWTNLYASGVAPAGTVYGRTLVGMLGATDGFGGTIWFDDVTQSVVSTTGTVSGLLHNPGFEDGPVGNAYNLWITNDLPSWTWIGGTNGGYITTSFAEEGNQSLSITYPDNLIGQSVVVTTGTAYMAEGWMMSPTNSPLTGVAYGSVLLQFFNGNYQSGTTAVSVVQTLPFTSAMADGTWRKFSVTNRAPWKGAATGEVLGAILGSSTGFAGAVYFDGFSMYATNIVVTNTQSGALWNPGFEYTADGTILAAMDNWTNLGFAGQVSSAHSHSGSKSLKIYFPETLAAQTWSATHGWKYSSSAWAFTPSDVDGANMLVNPQLTGSGATPTNWSGWNTGNQAAENATYLSSPNSWAFWWAGGIYQDITTGFQPGQVLKYGGWLYTPTWDPLTNGDKSGMFSLEFYDVTNGLLGTVLSSPAINSGSAQATWIQSQGTATVPANTVRVRMLVRCNATTGNGRFFADDVYLQAAATTADRFTSTTNTEGVVVLQFLDATGTNVLASYTSAAFTPANPPDTWTNLSATGVAPAGTVYGRTLVGMLGATNGFSGSIWFDDAVQSVVSTTGTVSGLLWNPSFEDGPPGNTYNLALVGDLPNWKWFGGTNAGFIATDNVKDGQQSLVLTYPQNSLVEDWTATSGHTYKAEGYLFTPSTAKFSTDGSSYGQIQMTFYVNGSSNVATSSVSVPFGRNEPANTWIYFAVTGTAPNVSIVTGRVTCTIFSPDPGSDLDLGGVIYFDQMTLNDTNATNSSPYAAWQISNFGSTNAPNSGPADDYDGDGYNNWSEFVAGTQPTNANSFLSATAALPTNGQYVISWPSVSGHLYTVKRGTNLSANAFTAIASNLVASTPQNAYTDAPPSSSSLYYYRVAVTNQ